MKANRSYFLLALVAVGFLLMIIDSLNNTGPDDLKGNFVEKIAIRNEQNTGPIVRIYAVTVSDTLWAEMKAFGNFKPHNKYGTTRVYYFLSNQAAPSALSIEDQNLSPEDQKRCIGKYEKNTMGQVSVVAYPFGR